MLAGFLEAMAVLQVGVEGEATLTRKRRTPSTRVTLAHHIVQEVQEDGIPTELPSEAMVTAVVLEDQAGEGEAARSPTVATPTMATLTTHMKLLDLTESMNRRTEVSIRDRGLGVGRELEEVVEGGVTSLTTITAPTTKGSLSLAGLGKCRRGDGWAAAAVDGELSPRLLCRSGLHVWMLLHAM